jgi:hypothetical protein
MTQSPASMCRSRVQSRWASAPGAAGDGLVPGGQDGHGETAGVQIRAGGAGAVGEASQKSCTCGPFGVVSVPSSKRSAQVTDLLGREVFVGLALVPPVSVGTGQELRP